MSHRQEAGRGRGRWVARNIGSCSVSPSVELLESKVSCIRRAWPREKLTEKVNEYNLLFLLSPDWPSSLLGVGGVGNADGQYRPRMKFLCVSFCFGFDSSTACLCFLVIFDRPFLSFTPNQELGNPIYKWYCPIFVFYLSDSLHSVGQSLGPSRLLQIAFFGSFF